MYSQAAMKYAKRTTSQRCAEMGGEKCSHCKKSMRGVCDYRTRMEAYDAGMHANRTKRMEIQTQ